MVVVETWRLYYQKQPQTAQWIVQLCVLTA
jgi:hypothetical protein